MRWVQAQALSESSSTPHPFARSHSVAQDETVPSISGRLRLEVQEVWEIPPSVGETIFCTVLLDGSLVVWSADSPPQEI